MSIEMLLQRMVSCRNVWSCLCMCLYVWVAVWLGKRLYVKWNY